MLSTIVVTPSDCSLLGEPARVDDLRVTANDFTHIGQGEENQDRVRVLTSRTSQDGDASLLVVADGLGGHSGAALAAQTLVDTADRLWGERAGSSDAEEFLRKLALESHAAVNKTGHEHGKDPRSTLAALLLNGSEAVSVHAGDSRVMQLSGDRVVKRTLDHSIGQPQRAAWSDHRGATSHSS